MTLPEKYQIQEGLIPEWVGRREFYEVVEELGRSIFWSIVYWSYVILPLVFGVVDPLTYGIIVGLIGFTIWIPAYIELEKWVSEVYVVANDPNNVGGMAYKFKGILNFSRLETPITAKSPVLVINEYENNIAYWVWKNLTGRRMQKVSLKSEAGLMFLNGNRISPEFVKAIERTRNAQAVKKDLPPIWQGIDGLIRAKAAGIWTPAEVTRKAEELWSDLRE